MILVLDVGNTNIVIGIYQGDNLKNSWRISTNLTKTADEYGLIIRELLGEEFLKIIGIGISSVVPSVINELEKMSHKYFNLNPIIVSKNLNTGITFLDNYEIGADLIAGAVTVAETYPNVATIIIDAGTATTFSVLSKDKIFLGGVIIPGIKITAEFLASKTSLLPKIELRKPEKLITLDTSNSIKAGIMYGYLGQVKEILAQLKKEFYQDYGKQKIKIIATGGLAKILKSEIKEIIFNDELVLKGIKIIYAKNC